MSAHTSTSSADDAALVSPEPGVEEHYPSEWEYIRIALILFVITMGEVGIYYVTGARQAVTTLMLGMMAVKFALVALYFMHLRWDNLFNSVSLLSAILFVGLFIVIASLDSGQYQHLREEYIKMYPR